MTLRVDIDFEDNDKGADVIVFKLDQYDGATVKAGLPESAGDTAAIGAWQELGTRTNPARPWLSIAADQNQETILDKAGAAAKRIASVRGVATPIGELDKLGRFVANKAKAVIRTGMVGGPDLDSETIEEKGNAKKLIADKGLLISRIAHEVEL